MGFFRVLMDIITSQGDRKEPTEQEKRLAEDFRRAQEEEKGTAKQV